MQKVSIVKGKDRKENIKRAINLIGKDIERAIKNKKSKKLFVKINAIDVKLPLACTHIDALDAVLSIFYEKFEEIIVGDNSFAFTKNNGLPYSKLSGKFPKVKFSDLTEFETESIEFKKLDGKTKGKISLLPEKAFTISLALPKSHDGFVYTGCLKNMFGCVVENKIGLHALSRYERLLLNKYVKSNKLKWQNLANVIKKTKPDLCILDGYEGMEGEGPLLGNRIELGIALCSLDGIALDKLGSRICGFEYVPYLSMFSDEKIEVIKDGFDKIEEISKKFKSHHTYKYQIMTNSLLLPLIDIKSIISELKRPYRFKDRVMEMIGRK